MSNVTLNAGSGGATLATDQVSGVDFQVVKLGVSDAGNAPAQVGPSNPLPVSDNGGSLTVDGTVAVSGTVHVDDNSSTLSVDDGGGSLTVDGTVAVSGTVHVDDNSSTLSIDDGGGSITVDNGGTFAVQAAQSGTWNVTNVSGTVSLPTGAATAAKQPALGTAGTASSDVLTVQGIASMTALKVDGSAITQGINISQVANNPADSNSGSHTSGTLRVVIATDQPQLSNKLLVTPDSVALPANQSVNVNQLGGTAPDTNSGNKSAGTLRVVLATDQPALTNKLLVTPDANSAINNAQIAGTTTATNNGTASAGCQRVTIASDNTAFSVNSTPKKATSGGLSVATGSIAATKTSVKGSAGQVYGWYFYNPNSSVAYVQFFDAATGSVTLGTTAPTYSIGIPATSGANVFTDLGIAHATAITIAITTTRAGSTGVSSTVDYNVFYG